MSTKNKAYFTEIPTPVGLVNTNTRNLKAVAESLQQQNAPKISFNITPKDVPKRDQLEEYETAKHYAVGPFTSPETPGIPLLAEELEWYVGQQAWASRTLLEYDQLALKEVMFKEVHLGGQTATKRGFIDTNVDQVLGARWIFPNNTPGNAARMLRTKQEQGKLGDMLSKGLQYGSAGWKMGGGPITSTLGAIGGVALGGVAGAVGSTADPMNTMLQAQRFEQQQRKLDATAGPSDWTRKDYETTAREVLPSDVVKYFDEGGPKESMRTGFKAAQSAAKAWMDAAMPDISQYYKVFEGSRRGAKRAATEEGHLEKVLSGNDPNNLRRAEDAFDNAMPYTTGDPTDAVQDWETNSEIAVQEAETAAAEAQRIANIDPEIPPGARRRIRDQYGNVTYEFHGDPPSQFDREVVMRNMDPEAVDFRRRSSVAFQQNKRAFQKQLRRDIASKKVPDYTADERQSNIEKNQMRLWNRAARLNRERMEDEYVNPPPLNTPDRYGGVDDLIDNITPAREARGSMDITPQRPTREVRARPTVRPEEAFQGRTRTARTREAQGKAARETEVWLNRTVGKPKRREPKRARPWTNFPKRRYVLRHITQPKGAKRTTKGDAAAAAYHAIKRAAVDRRYGQQVDDDDDDDADSL